MTTRTTAIRQKTLDNRLLSAIGTADYAWLSEHLEPVTLELQRVLSAANQPVTHVYFPESGVASIVNAVAGGQRTEVGTVGPEGMTGIQAILTGEPMPSETFIQVAGHGYRVPAALFAAGVAERPALRRVVDRYTQAFMIQLAQTATCNLLHTIDERCARWLLMTHDRVGRASTFDLTHQFLAFMLGVRRAGVTVAAGALQREGIIRYSRGRVTVLDRHGLEAAACECYGVVRESFDRLVGGDATTVARRAIAS